MTLDTLIMLAGAFIVIEPQLGFPGSWDGAILFVVGILVIAAGIAVRRRTPSLPQDRMSDMSVR